MKCPKCKYEGEFEEFLGQKPIEIKGRAEVEEIYQCPKCGEEIKPIKGLKYILGEK